MTSERAGLTPAERALRAERLNTLAHAAQSLAGGWLPLSIRYGLAEKMLDGVEAWEAERGTIDRYITQAYEVAPVDPINYRGPDPSVKCGHAGCTNLLRRSDFGDFGPQFCSREHRHAAADVSSPAGFGTHGGSTSGHLGPVVDG